MTKITMPQLIKKYLGKYIDVYEVRKAFSTIHENTALVTKNGFTY